MSDNQQNLAPTTFDTLDLLDTLGNATTMHEFTMRLGVTERTAQRRMSPLVEAGLVSVESVHDTKLGVAATYRTTTLGKRALREAYARMVGNGTPPKMDLDVWNAARIASGAYEAHHGTEAAA